jgi:Uma2 family endonuclease
MSALEAEKIYTPEQYLEFEREAEERHEYLDGQIYLMHRGSPNHNAIREPVTATIQAPEIEDSPKHSSICVNSLIALGLQLRRKPCQIFEANMKVGTETSSQFSYPDASVVCGEAKFHDKHQDILTNPYVIIEVLSPSTERFDRGKKFARYQRIDSFTDYVLIAQDEPRVEHFARQANGTWILTVAIGLKSKIKLASIACALKLAEVYDRIQFEEEEEPVQKKVTSSRRKKANKQQGKT